VKGYESIKVVKTTKGPLNITLAWDGKRLSGFIFQKKSKPVTKRRKK
jgi:hypothetical protein